VTNRVVTTPTGADPGVRRNGLRVSRWVTAVEALLGVCFTVGVLACLLLAVWSTVTFFGEHATSLMRSSQRAWEQRAMWFAVGPSAAGVVLAAVARRRTAGWVFGLMLALGLFVVIGLTWPEPFANAVHDLRHRLSP
jgi:amino acid transporter